MKWNERERLCVLVFERVEEEKNEEEDEEGKESGNEKALRGCWSWTWSAKKTSARIGWIGNQRGGCWKRDAPPTVCRWGCRYQRDRRTGRGPSCSDSRTQ